jgi:hypothetical protein
MNRGSNIPKGAALARPHEQVVRPSVSDTHHPADGDAEAPDPPETKRRS